MSDAHFKGYVAHDKDAIGNLKYESFTPKNWTEDDVEIVRHPFRQRVLVWVPLCLY